ncbi:MAG TPA: ATP-binding cassette domain-containing protein, partial [Anaerolineales bacterium]|nr:ATP-binding cassette domain-containing protein [Anaerolineales bacterium]
MTETSNSHEIIICRDVHKWFDQFHVLKGISLTVEKGEVVVIFGPSGSGKSTFIRCLNRLEEHQKGQIIIDGIELGNDIRNVEKIRQEVGMVFQQFNLFPHLTVMQNITLAPSWVKRVPKEQSREQAMQLLRRVGIPEQ